MACIWILIRQTEKKKKGHSEKFEHELVFDKVKELLILF